jgi:hypothetical protein
MQRTGSWTSLAVARVDPADRRHRAELAVRRDWAPRDASTLSPLVSRHPSSVPGARVRQDRQSGNFPLKA